MQRKSQENPARAARRKILGYFTQNTKEIQRKSKENPAREARRKILGVFYSKYKGNL
jgi:hypothetical protein